VTNDELIAQVCPLINDSGWAYYFTPSTMARGTELGLKGPQFYFIGRGGLLGNCDSTVVASAFGYFNPEVIKRAWDSSRTMIEPITAGLAHLECSAVTGREKLSSLEGLGAFVTAAEKVNQAANPEALALYAAFKSAPLVDDLPGRAMQLVSILREFRGSAHLVAVRAMGLTGKQAHFIKRPNDVAMFGWSPDDAPAIDDDDQRRLTEAESLTDRIVAPAYAVLDEAERDHLLAGAKAIKQAVSA
jgi:hypothetical protein